MKMLKMFVIIVVMLIGNVVYVKGDTEIFHPQDFIGSENQQDLWMNHEVDVGYFVNLMERIDGDLNGDSVVNLIDFVLLARQWQNSDCNEQNQWCQECDVDQSGAVGVNDLDVMAGNWLEIAIQENEPNGIVWVSVDDPGVDEDGDGFPDHEPFSGEMSKYEMTNAQYCQFLNDAKTDGLIMVYEDSVYVSSDVSHSQVCFDTYSVDPNSQIIFDGSVFGVRSRDGYDMSNHPVVKVSWYGATAFCDYYGYRLPTEWEWQAVADFDGSYVYGCGITISSSSANYEESDDANPLGLTSTPYTTPIGYYTSYHGYGMNDMAGNVWEWTSTVSDGNYIVRGGSWFSGISDCLVSNRSDSGPPYGSAYHVGFRVCR